MYDIHGKTALVTGAGKRIGRAIALSLAGLGADIIIHYNSSKTEAEEVAALAEKTGVRAWPLAAELADSREAEAFFGECRRTAGDIDILVNSASIFPEGTLDEVSYDDFDLNLRINALSPFLLGRELARTADQGCILNLLDTRITDYDRKHVAYHASKRLLFSLTRMMSLEFAPAVRVNAVGPGLILPPPGEDDSYLRRFAHTNPLERYGTVEDISRAAVFLIQSDFVTGQIIYVDGGRHLRGNVYGA